MTHVLTVQGSALFRFKDGRVVDQNEMALDRQWVADRSRYVASLYHEFASDVVRVQALQRSAYASLYRGRAFFGDVEGEFLYLAVRKMRPETIVEIGPGSGWSTSWIARAMDDNGVGHLTMCDIRDHPRLPLGLTHNVDFLRTDALTVDFPKPIDFLLSDCDHDDRTVYALRDKLWHTVRPGGLICVHDVFMTRTSAHAEATGLYQYLDTHDLQCFTLGQCFTEQHAVILAAREKVGLGPLIMPNDKTCLAVVEQPERAYRCKNSS